MAAALLLAPAALAAGSTPAARCNAKLRKHDGADVLALSPNQILALAKDIGDVEPLLRPGRRRLRLQLLRTAHAGRIYSRADRADPGDASLRQGVAFENELRALRRVATATGLRACSVRLAG